MPAPKPRATPGREDDALVRVLEASIEILRTENEILRRRLAAAETWAAQAVITRRSTSRSPSTAGRGRGGWSDDRAFPRRARLFGRPGLRSRRARLYPRRF